MRLALWIVAILMSLVVAPAYSNPANEPTPGATDGGQSYFVTWFGTGKGSNTQETFNLANILTPKSGLRFF